MSKQFGFDRGRPIDRYYIEGFLAHHAQDIRGRVLEVGDNSYTRQFGGARVTQSDILDITMRNPRVTLVADLGRPHAPLPSACFDCVILTQTLQLIYDVRAALRNVRGTLRPGGVLLATVPGISQVTGWRHAWCWAFTPVSVRQLFGEVFHNGISVQDHGNVLAAIAFLEGIAAEELTAEDLRARDPDYPLLITVRAVRGAS